MHLTQLPQEVILLISSNLNPIALYRLSLSCKYFASTLIDSEVAWKFQCLNFFPNLNTCIPYKQAFQQLFSVPYTPCDCCGKFPLDARFQCLTCEGVNFCMQCADNNLNVHCKNHLLARLLDASIDIEDFNRYCPRLFIGFPCKNCKGPESFVQYRKKLFQKLVSKNNSQSAHNHLPSDSILLPQHVKIEQQAEEEQFKNLVDAAPDYCCASCFKLLKRQGIQYWKLKFSEENGYENERVGKNPRNARCDVNCKNICLSSCYGIQWKCLKCEDFDTCEKCEDEVMNKRLQTNENVKNHHYWHPMVRLYWCEFKTWTR